MFVPRLPSGNSLMPMLSRAPADILSPGTHAVRGTLAPLVRQYCHRLAPQPFLIAAASRRKFCEHAPVSDSFATSVSNWLFTAANVRNVSVWCISLNK